ncbi:hypothetical protein HZC30_02890 [Candidatus Woesearchaeota archaeon]|nr:hypothetical protein [Candidatus Woesearchaeota archaeon]
MEGQSSFQQEVVQSSTEASNVPIQLEDPLIGFDQELLSAGISVLDKEELSQLYRAFNGDVEIALKYLGGDITTEEAIAQYTTDMESTPETQPAGPATPSPPQGAPKKPAATVTPSYSIDPQKGDITVTTAKGNEVTYTKEEKWGDKQMYQSPDKQFFIIGDDGVGVQVKHDSPGQYCTKADCSQTTSEIKDARKSDYLGKAVKIEIDAKGEAQPPKVAAQPGAPATPGGPAPSAPPQEEPLKKKEVPAGDEKKNWKGDLSVAGLPGDGQVEIKTDKSKNPYLDLDCGSICTDQPIKVDSNGNYIGWTEQGWVQIPPEVIAKIPNSPARANLMQQQADIEYANQMLAKYGGAQQAATTLGIDTSKTEQVTEFQEKWIKANLPKEHVCEGDKCWTDDKKKVRTRLRG